MAGRRLSARQEPFLLPRCPPAPSKLQLCPWTSPYEAPRAGALAHSRPRSTCVCRAWCRTGPPLSHLEIRGRMTAPQSKAFPPSEQPQPAVAVPRFNALSGICCSGCAANWFAGATHLAGNGGGDPWAADWRSLRLCRPSAFDLCRQSPQSASGQFGRSTDRVREPQRSSQSLDRGARLAHIATRQEVAVGSAPAAGRAPCMFPGTAAS